MSDSTVPVDVGAHLPLDFLENAEKLDVWWQAAEHHRHMGEGLRSQACSVVEPKVAVPCIPVLRGMKAANGAPGLISSTRPKCP